MSIILLSIFIITVFIVVIVIPYLSRFTNVEQNAASNDHFTTLLWREADFSMQDMEPPLQLPDPPLHNTSRLFVSPTNKGKCLLSNDKYSNWCRLG
jgi:hypothetical protein